MGRLYCTAEDYARITTVLVGKSSVHICYGHNRLDRDRVLWLVRATNVLCLSCAVCPSYFSGCVIIVGYCSIFSAEALTLREFPGHEIMHLCG